jgi:hypothetical protein
MMVSMNARGLADIEVQGCFSAAARFEWRRVDDLPGDGS